jgi:uncharacterized phiE125 gp8 family phage protein
VDYTEDDDLIIDLIEAARRYCETLMGVAFITQTIEAVYDDWCINVPLSNIQSVTSVQYYDEDNTLQTLNSDTYIVDAKGKPNSITRHKNYQWPPLFDRPSPVIVTYVAGFGDAANDVEKEFVVPVYKVLSEWYELREDKPWEKVTASRYLIRKNAVWSF